MFQYVKTDFIELKMNLAKGFIMIPELYDNSRSFMTKVRYSYISCLGLMS